MKKNKKERKKKRKKHLTLIEFMFSFIAAGFLFRAHEHLASRVAAFAKVEPGYLVPGFLPVRSLMANYFHAKVKA